MTQVLSEQPIQWVRINGVTYIHGPELAAALDQWHYPDVARAIRSFDEAPPTETNTVMGVSL